MPRRQAHSGKPKLINREVLPRHIMGVDWGAESVVLVRDQTHALIWRFSCKAWADRMIGYTHHPATLSIVDTREVYSLKEIHEGGRLSIKLIRNNCAAIDQQFGPGTVERIDIKRTLVLP